MAVGAALVTLAATAASVYASRDASRDAKRDQQDQMAAARKNEENAKTQKEVTSAARVARAQQLSMAGGGYQSTIATSPLGLSGGGSPAAAPLKTRLGE